MKKTNKPDDAPTEWGTIIAVILVIAALVLIQFGTGAVRGFAVTLSLGVLASLFTALILSRLIFDFLLINRKIKRISI